MEGERPSALICGIDPGITGGVAFIYADGSAEVFDMPVVYTQKRTRTKTLRKLKIVNKPKHVDGGELHRLISSRRPARVRIELVGSMPGQGLSSTFKFGTSYGLAIGAAQSGTGFEPEFVTPQRWKSGLGIPKSKQVALAKAKKMFPALAHEFVRITKDIGKAEAALIAKHGLLA